MTHPSAVLARVPQGIELRQQGRNREAREVFDQLWAEIGGEAGDPMARCMIAHSNADAQDDVEDELRWDHIALDAARAVTDEQVTAAGMDASGAAALFPSLHLNLAECYRKLGNFEQARAHLSDARQTLDALPDGDYATTIRDSFNELARTLDT